MLTSDQIKVVLEGYHRYFSESKLSLFNLLIFGSQERS